MADKTKIEWTEATWNPITGCSVHSAGCTNCYAMKLAGTRLQHHPSRSGLTVPSKAGPVWTGEVRFNEQWLTQPLKWKKPRMIFVCAHADLFHESVPDEWIDRIFAVMALCPQHTFQVLTKRSARMREYLDTWKPWVDPRSFVLSAEKMQWSREVASGPRQPSYITKGGLSPNDRPKGSPLIHYTETGWPLANVWLGVSVENQAAADERIPDLLVTPAALRWISAEPLLGPVDLTQIPAPDQIEGKTFEEGWSFNSLYMGDYYSQRSENTFGEVFYSGGDGPYRETELDWVVAGGESGKGARPMHPDWARNLRDQCAAAGTPFFFKQWGEWLPCDLMPPKAKGWKIVDGQGFAYVGKTTAGRLLDGVEHNGMPA